MYKDCFKLMDINKVSSLSSSSSSLPSLESSSSSTPASSYFNTFIIKDGTIDKNDLRGAFDNVGVLMTESELDELLGEISGPCTYDNMVKMFQDKMAGGRQKEKPQPPQKINKIKIQTIFLISSPSWSTEKLEVEDKNYMSPWNN